MTKLQLYKKIKSLRWRRNLAKNLNEIEAEIKAFMSEKKTKSLVIAGCLVKLVNDEIFLEKQPVINHLQMKFSFSKGKEAMMEFCPECEAQLIHAEGCMFCPCCGYSKCACADCNGQEKGVLNVQPEITRENSNDSLQAKTEL